MPPVLNTRVIFKSIPQGYPVPGQTLAADHSQKIDLDNVSLAGGKILAKTLSISIDPYLRGKMNGTEKMSFEIGHPHAVAKVIRSENPKFKVGDHIYGIMDWAEYQIFENVPELRILPPNSGIPWSVFPGKTAYYAWQEVAQGKEGETIYVSTAAGAVGSVVVQLAKQAGLKVIASAGHESKLQFLRDLGADVVFNYKTESMENVLKDHEPIDIYWDHVGGKTTSTVLMHMNTFGRVVVIGQISTYNVAEADAVSNFPQILFRRLTVRGLGVIDHEAKHGDEFYATIPGMIARGELKYNETIVRSLDEAPQLFLDVQKGDNSGKAVIVLADD
ncbi:alcohol dehydrogenase [Auricularia subglabra TFB-10046 SS5]|uniref:Alcohol dehydrogenase n=1 Tax=Auricularia subglabra (strain TFB-10046 / SS5) TaxID=717982 RepID=J0WU73_AURST|nr:alcohol dehydrogenase [Auricularia subglabra TFB-10046 SS5]